MRIFRYIVPALLLMAACQREDNPATPEPPVTPSPQLVEHTLYASTPGEDAPETRTVVSSTDDKKILWSAHEKISILSGGGNYSFEGDNDAPAAAATFTGTAPADLGNYIALYPYDSFATYTDGYVSTKLTPFQLGKDGSFRDGYLVTADDATGNSISFNHVCSGLRFMVNADNIKAVSIRGNNGEKIAGDFRFRFTAPDTPVAEAGTEQSVTLSPSSGSAFEAGKYYYIIILPTVFSKGFTITADNGSQIGELRFDSSATFTAGKFKNVTGNLDERMTWTTPSSRVYYGQENSFCLRPGETVSFDVNPRKIYGSWQRSGLPASTGFPDEAEVLWGGGAISELSVSTDGKLTVTASGTPGSALVAIKKNDTILWSYLIWVTESAPAETTLPSGAKALPALGGNCYFQWGRKDPLLSSADRVTNPGSGCLAYSISHPTEYIKNNTAIYDWIDDIDWTLWGDGAAKTVWDPCPAGYRVPAKDDFSGITESFLTGNFEALGYIADNGYKNYTDYCYWTRSTDFQGDVRKLSWCLSWYPDTSEADILLTDYRYMAYPVRCVKE